MPELPDINAYLCALDARIVGQTLERVRLANAFVLRTAQPPITEVQGVAVRELRRIGKRVAIGLHNDLWVVIHLMIASCSRTVHCLVCWAPIGREPWTNWRRSRGGERKPGREPAAANRAAR